MIIKAQAPSRISLFGGGSDLEHYFLTHGGIVVSMAINLRTHISLYTDDDLFTHPFVQLPLNVSPELCYRILKDTQMDGMHSAGLLSSFDGVISAGLGSSASFCVALLAAIDKFRGRALNQKSITSRAYKEEMLMGWIGGYQDQYAASYGGFNVITFGKEININQYTREIGENLKSYLHLFYTGGERKSYKVQKSFTTLDDKTIKHLDKIKDIAFIAQKAIYDGRMEIVGKLLNATWEEKKKTNKVTTPKIDDIYDYAIKSGAMGGKLLGAGQAGYMVFFVSPEKSDSFLKEMKKKNLEETDFSIDWQGVESRIL